MNKITSYFKLNNNVSIPESTTISLNRNNVSNFGIVNPQTNVENQSKNLNVSSSNYNIKFADPVKHPEVKNFFKSLNEHIASIHTGPNLNMRDRIQNKALDANGQDIYHIADKPVLPEIMKSLSRTQTVRSSLNSTTEYTTPIHIQKI